MVAAAPLAAGRVSTSESASVCGVVYLTRSHRMVFAILLVPASHLFDHFVGAEVDSMRRT
jgi:hypothetical protein